MILKNRLMINEIRYLKIDITWVAYAELTSKWKQKEHVLNKNMFSLITEGEVDIWCNGERVHMTPGNIYFLPKGCRRAYNCPNYVHQLYFYVELNSISAEQLSITPNRCAVLPNCTDLIDEMVSLYNKNDYHSAITLRLYMEQIVLEVMQQFPNKKNIQHHSPLINKVLHIISESPHLSLTAAVLSERTLSTVPYLRQRFKREMGISLGKYVQNQVLNATAQDILFSNYTLTEISAKYGFCDQFYFSRLFTAHFGIPPSKYAKEY